jgi:outer membrane receptor protein involved in Fe transport
VNPHRGAALVAPALAVAAVLLLPPPARGDEGARQDESEPISLDTLLDTVVTATLRLQPTLEAPASIIVVSAAEIRERGYKTIKAIINDVPGFNDVSDSNEEIVAVRGVFTSTTNKILTLVNGHRMNDLMLGRYNVDQFLGMDAIERVEFIRGPVSALYGTGALVGVVNIITRSGAALDGTRLELRGGPFSQQGSLSWGKSLLGHDVFFNFTFLDARGQTIPQAASLDHPPEGQPARAGVVYLGRYHENFSGLVTVRSDDSTLVLRGAHFRSVPPRGANGSLYDYAREPYKPTFTENDMFVDYSRTFTLGATGGTRLTVNPSFHFFSYLEQSVFNFTSDREPPVGERGSHQDEFNHYQLKLTLERSLREDLDLIVGLDGLLASFYRSDAVRVVDGQLIFSPQGNTPPGRWFLGGGFLQMVYAPRKTLSLTLGVRYDTFQAEAPSQVTPRLGLVYRPLPAVALKALYGRSYLAPMWAHKRARDGVYFGNPDLEPESFDSADLIAAYGGRLGSATVDVFYNQVTGLINAVRQPPDPTGQVTYQYQNSPVATRYFGFELAGEAQVARAVRLQGSYSYVRPGPHHQVDPVLVGQSIREIPAHTLRYGGRVEPAKGLVLSLWGRATSSRQSHDDVAQPRVVVVPAVLLLDASALYTWRNVTLQIVATNLTDRHHEIGGTVVRPLARERLNVEGIVSLRL